MAAARRAIPRLSARLSARPPAKHAGLLSPGLHSVPCDPHRPATLYVPECASRGEPTPLVVLLHGAGASALNIVPVLRSQAEHHGFLLLAPQSSAYTWDTIASRGAAFGADVEMIDQLLGWLFAEANVERSKIAISGFSDGASYALSVGLANGDLFTHILAFSPGFMSPPDFVAKPSVFVSHGTDDAVLPILCGRKVSEQLDSWKYPLKYVEFHGHHAVPHDIAEAGARWFLPEKV